MADFNVTHMPCTVETYRVHVNTHREFNWKIWIETTKRKENTCTRRVPQEYGYSTYTRTHRVRKGQRHCAIRSREKGNNKKKSTMTWKLSSGDEWSEETRKYVHTKKNLMKCVWIRMEKTRRKNKTERLTSDRPTKKKQHTHTHTALSFERRTNESHTKNWKQTATTNHLHITHSPILILIHNHISYYTHYMYFYIETERKNFCLLCHKNNSVVSFFRCCCCCCQCVYLSSVFFLLATGIDQRSPTFSFAEDEWEARGRRNSCRGCWCCYCCRWWFCECQRQQRQRANHHNLQLLFAFVARMIRGQLSLLFSCFHRGRILSLPSIITAIIWRLLWNPI